MGKAQKNKHKKWWAAVWTGLVMDQDGTHYYQMRNALWLFLYLLLNADRKTGFLVRKVQTICKDTGINRETILRWLMVLRKQGYIVTKSNGRCLQIQIKKWKGADVSNVTTQKSEKSDTRRDKDITSESSHSARFSVYFPKKPGDFENPNDRTIKKNILKNDIDREVPFNRRASKGPDKKQLLALELADALDDRKSLALYIAYSRRYPERLLRKALTEAKDIPSNKIKKSRAALFNHLVQKHAQETFKDSGRQSA